MSSNILITGSGKGIGRALAKKFAFSDETNSLILNSRTGSDLFSLSKELKTSKKKIDIYECDLSSKKDCIDLAEFSNQKKINFLINNAALPCPGLPLDKIPLDQIYKIIETNLIAPIILCKKIKGLEKIVNLNSIVGLEHKHLRSVYSSSKWGLRGFSESYKLESRAKIIDVYLSRVITRKEFNESDGMDIDFAVSQIFKALKTKNQNIIIDDRPRVN